MAAEKKEIAVGGQAVIEGVMMRGPEHIATAVRRKDGTIEVKKEKFVSITQKVKFLGLPLIRGFVSLIEMMKIGFKTLNFSADRAALDLEEEEKESKKPGFLDNIAGILSYVVAIGLAVGLFMVLPYKLADWINLSQDNLYFNLFAGVFRIIVFIVYLALISLMKDIRRVFEYHGAEHKSVFAYENNDILAPAEVQKYTTLHPRCGTSFLFFVLLIAILFFSIIDTIYTHFFGSPELFLRLGYHLLFTPVISGISFEVLRFSGKKRNNPLIKIMTFPGLSLQRITTQPPDDDQIEVALVALKAALGLDQENQKLIWVNEDQNNG